MSTALAKTLNMHFWRGWVLDLPKWWSTFVTVFLSIFSEAFPFLMLGSALAAAVHLYVPEKIIVKIIGKKGISRYIAAGFAGLIFPVCECAIVPIGGSLIRKKVPPSVVVSFMAAAPVVNPLVALSTLAAFNGELRVVFARVGLAFVVAVLTGVFLHSIGIDRVPPIRPGQEHQHEHDHQHKHGHSSKRGIGLFLSTTAEELFSAGRFLVMGTAIAALFQVSVPRSVLAGIAPNPFVGTAAMMSGAYLSALCSEADAFVAAPFRGCLPIGALMGFLVYGPMIDIKNTLLLMATFQRSFVIQVIIAITVITFCAVVGFSLI